MACLAGVWTNFPVVFVKLVFSFHRPFRCLNVCLGILDPGPDPGRIFLANPPRDVDEAKPFKKPFQSQSVHVKTIA
jgi:hypothetical protein